MIASILENDSVHFEHRGVAYTIARLGPTDWTIQRGDGLTIGSLTVMSPEGEEHEPVYGGIIAGQTDTDYEGSDWESIVRGLVNEELEAEDEAAAAALGGGVAPAADAIRASAVQTEPSA